MPFLNFVRKDTKSTLALLQSEFLPNKLHDAVAFTSNVRQVTRANIKIRVMAGVYPLQTLRKNMKKAKDDTCLLCNTDTEDTTHFLAACPALESVRKKQLVRLEALLPELLLDHIKDPSLLTKLLLDTTQLQTFPPLDLPTPQLQHATSELIYALHLKRSEILKSQKEEMKV
jgi:hypothetical protein